MPREELDRPILSGGEKLSELIEKPRGFGSKYHPQEPEEARELLRPQVERLEEQVDQIPREHRGSRVNFEATLLPNYLAGSYFPSRLISHLGLHYLGNRATEARYQTQTIDEIRPSKSLIVAGSDSAIAAFGNLVQEEVSDDTRDLWEDLRELTEIGIASADKVVRSRPEGRDPEDEITWEAVLHQVAGETGREVNAEQDLIFERWIAFIEDLEGAVAEDYRRIVDGLTFVPVSLPIRAIDDTVRFNPLRAIRPMPEMRPTPVQVLRNLGTDDSPDPPSPDDSPRTDSRVAVFDGGVDPDDPYIQPFVNLRDLTTEDSEDNSVQHGTLVTNAVLHGFVDGGTALTSPAAWVDHYRILPTPPANGFDLELNWILDQIVSTLEDQNYKLVNLSLGPDVAIAEDDEPHRWTSELDKLARDKGVLFVSAVGNNGEGDEALGLNRIQTPADMVNGLGVGACDRPDEEGWARASYSAVGPGRWGARIQPTGVTFGGNDDQPFVGLGRMGHMIASAGTSFSAPIASHGLAGVMAELGPDAVSPHLLRVFAVHFAVNDEEHDLTEVGFGRLQEEYGHFFNCTQNRVTLLYRGLMPRQDALSAPLPFPSGLEDGLRISFRWTLCFTSDIHPSEVTDYTGSGVEVTFRPHARRYRLYHGDRTHTLDVEEDEEEFNRLIMAGANPSAHPVSESRGHVRHTEQQRREAGKWETVVYQEFAKHTQTVFQPRLDLDFLARKDGQLITDDVEPLEFALLVSLEVRRDVDLYSLVRQEFDVLTPIATEVEVRV